MKNIVKSDNEETEIILDDGIPETCRRPSKRDEAIFRLGQMDFQQCAADALEDASKTIENGLVSLAFLQAAALVRDMKVPDGCIEE